MHAIFVRFDSAGMLTHLFRRLTPRDCTPRCPPSLRPTLSSKYHPATHSRSPDSIREVREEEEEEDEEVGLGAEEYSRGLRLGQR
jgi:hypothetical protein